MSAVEVLIKLFLYTCAMFTLPFFAFFMMKCTLRDYFHIDGFANNAWSVAASVIVVNLIIAVYVYNAYHEPEPEDIDEHPRPTVRRSDLNLKQD